MSYEVDNELINCFQPEVYSELVNLFKKYDSNHNAVIEKNEFYNMIKELGFSEMSKKDVNALFKNFDLNNDKVISFYEFLQIMKTIKK